jgi:hypothetical protein
MFCRKKNGVAGNPEIAIHLQIERIPVLSPVFLLVVFRKSGSYKIKKGLENRLLERTRDLRLSPENLIAPVQSHNQLLGRRLKQQVKRRE